MAAQKDAAPEGLERYPCGTIITGNLAMALIIGVGTWACWLFHPLAAWLYLAYGIIMVYFVMRRLVCIHCYYYDKWCALGWGKLAALLYKPGNPDEFGSGPAIKMAGAVYGLLMLVPIVLVIIMMVQAITVLKVVLLGLLLLMTAYSALSRKGGCARCKQGPNCPGSAAK